MAEDSAERRGRRGRRGGDEIAPREEVSREETGRGALVNMQEALEARSGERRNQLPRVVTRQGRALGLLVLNSSWTPHEPDY